MFFLVSGLSVVPSNQISLSSDYEFWIDAKDIGDVMFAVKLVTGIHIAPLYACIYTVMFVYLLQEIFS